ncbi:GSCFA domain-containing protein [Gymnodinialimonas ceratoperidinii]|uniref:GSCFA domain-containing protein n=1 Tax=Gymnodinialimonas ceratoperidinii TaxID=2856823 RepID=A0A8F6TV75_9RHOB|nr:GSCFA domain-containing protein [Gymnodinialimonas ceratoperidinii]QXT39300.1 GSCFA domain-containing protein [Gymnodinialimonas ceratoperidinii]
MPPPSPYRGLPARAFWRGAVAGASPFPTDIYRPKFAVTRDTKVFTAGSCFAQHVGAAMKAAGIGVIDAEPARRGMTPETAKRFGYGVYSARFGNLYTVRQFRQLVAEMNGAQPALPVWERDGRFWDALRPGVEPEGLATPELVAEMRAQHLSALARALQEAEVIVFTLGLTEAWEHRQSGTVYPTAPGTIAGSYDPEVFRFVNYGVADIVEDFTALETSLASINPDLKWLLTVSPVPLAATAKEDHVLAATTRSKATLRVVCDMLAESSPRIDYFPSYELVTSPAHPRSPFAEDLRSVRPEIVAQIMQTFLAAHGLGGAPDAAASPNPTNPSTESESDAVCEDILLDAFAPDRP